MAYSFDTASSQYLSASSAPVSAIPLTIAMYSKTPIPTAGTNFALDTRGGTNRVQVYNGSSGSNVSTAAQINGGGIAYSTGNAGGSAWRSTVGVYSASNLRYAYVAGGNRGQNTADFSTTWNNLTIGARIATTVGAFYTGDLAEIAVWSEALTDDEVASLGKGFKPTRVRPQNLVFYAPLIRTLQDVRAGLALTNNNSATVADHPRVY